MTVVLSSMVGGTWYVVIIFECLRVSNVRQTNGDDSWLMIDDRSLIVGLRSLCFQQILFIVLFILGYQYHFLSRHSPHHHTDRPHTANNNIQHHTLLFSLTSMYLGQCPVYTKLVINHL